MLKRFRLVGVCLVVVFAVGVVGVSSASAAAPGPFFKTGAGTLGEGQTVVLKAKLKTVDAFLDWPALKAPLIQCTAASGEGKAYNEYVKGVLKEGRLKEAKIVLEDCEVVEGSGCKINGKEGGEAPIAFEHVLGRLGYNPSASEKEREEGKGVEELMYPEAGKDFGGIKFSGGTCALSGSFAEEIKGGLIWSGAPVNKLATSLLVYGRVTATFSQELKEINFPAFSETLTNQELVSGSARDPAALEGELTLTPPAGVELGVFT